MFVVNPDLHIYQDRDDAKYLSGFRTFTGENAQREAIEHVIGVLRLRRDAAQAEIEKYQVQLRALPPRFPVGAQVVVEGQEAVVVKVDPDDSIYPYMVFFPASEVHDWYTSEEVKAR